MQDQIAPFKVLRRVFAQPIKREIDGNVLFSRQWEKDTLELVQDFSSINAACEYQRTLTFTLLRDGEGSLPFPAENYFNRPKMIKLARLCVDKFGADVGLNAEEMTFLRETPADQLLLWFADFFESDFLDSPLWLEEPHKTLLLDAFGECFFTIQEDHGPMGSTAN